MLHWQLLSGSGAKFSWDPEQFPGFQETQMTWEYVELKIIFYGQLNVYKILSRSRNSSDTLHCILFNWA